MPIKSGFRRVREEHGRMRLIYDRFLEMPAPAVASFWIISHRSLCLSTLCFKEEVGEPHPADARQGPLPAGVQASHVAPRAAGRGPHGQRRGPTCAEQDPDPNLQRELPAREAPGGHQEPPRQVQFGPRGHEPAPGDEQGFGLQRPAA